MFSVNKWCRKRILTGIQKSFSKEKRKYEKIKNALSEAEESGYGVVLPSVDEMDLEEPVQNTAPKTMQTDSTIKFTNLQFGRNYDPTNG